MSDSHEMDRKLDGWLADWPVPERSDREWEEFGSKLDERLSGLTIGHGDDAWLQPPLPDQPGEGDREKLLAGGVSMSERNSERPPKKSLKDFAQRVSAIPTADTKSAPISSMGTPIPSSGPRASSPSLRASVERISHPPEARDSDSGIVDLNAVRAKDEPDSGAQPAETGLFDGETKAPAPAPAAKKTSMAPVVGGGIVAVLALAAATVLVVRTSEKSAPNHLESTPAVASVAATPAAEHAGLASPRSASNTDQELSVERLGVAESSGESAEGQPFGANAAPGRAGGSAAADKAKTEASVADKDGKKEDSPATPADTKDLAGAMATAVGAHESKKDDGKKSSTSSVDPGSLPETPSQGAVQGAMGSVRDAARACVAGQTESSRATITFGSSGSVSSVSVSGGAAGTPAAGCIQAALKRARVGPFKKDSFTVSMTIRP